MYRPNGNCVVNPDNVAPFEAESIAGFIGIILLIGVHQFVD
jgi:hypothetical protein